LGFKEKRTRRVLYRIDGIRGLYGGIPGNKMDVIQGDCISLADHVIFQSEFSRGSFRDNGYKFGENTIVHNGADTALFNTDGISRRDGREKLNICACSWSDNPAKGHAIMSGISGIKDVEVSFIGRWHENTQPGKVKMLGIKNKKEIAQIFKDSDVFLCPSRNESCSNTLLEALSCGLPVIYLDSGSNAEIASDYGVRLDTDNTASTIREMTGRYNELADKVKSDNTDFSIQKAGKEYVKIASSMIK